MISPICLCQWQVSWSCSLYSFSHKSLLIVSLEGCCASPALGPWQSADPGPSSRSSGMPGPLGSAQTPTAYKNLESATAANQGFLVADVVTVKPRFLVLSSSWLFTSFTYLFFVRAVTHWGPLTTGDYDRFQTPLQVIWHLNHVPLFWLDPLPQLYLGWKDLSSHWLLCSMAAVWQPAWWSNSSLDASPQYELSMNWKHLCQWYRTKSIES